jgi:hypothetical protein
VGERQKHEWMDAQFFDESAMWHFKIIYFVIFICYHRITLETHNGTPSNKDLQAPLFLGIILQSMAGVTQKSSKALYH